MKRILAPILLLTFLFPSLAYGQTRYSLVERDGIHYKKFSDVPFTGKVDHWIRGTLNKGTLKGGLWDGPYAVYHPNGQLTVKGTYKDGVRDGIWVNYFNDGDLGGKQSYKTGKKHGPWVSYRGNGQLRFKGTYKNGKKDGPWVSYNEDGTVFKIFTGTYKNGEKVK